MFDFARIAGGSHVSNAADENKDNGNNTGKTEEPLNDVRDHLSDLGVSSDATCGGGEVAAKITIVDSENDADGAHDGASEHGNSEADESVGEGPLAGGDFAGVTT